MYSKANYINRKSVKSNLKSMKSLFLSIEEIARNYNVKCLNEFGK